METTQTKQSAFDLVHDKRKLEETFERMLLEADGEITEEIDQLYQQIIDLEDSIEDKVKAYRWVKLKIEAEVAAWKGRYEHWKKVAEVDRKVQKARENNVANLKSRVVMLLRSLDEESVKIDGKKIYLRDYYKVSITNDELAYHYLSDHELASRRSILEDEDVNDLLDGLHLIRQEMQDESGQPMKLSPEANTAIGRAIEIIQQSGKEYVFAKATELSKHAKQLHNDELSITVSARERLEEITALEAANGYDDEGLGELQKEKANIQAYLEKVSTDHSIPGATIELSKSVFGL